jgi:hypothetical protein
MPYNRRVKVQRKTHYRKELKKSIVRLAKIVLIDRNFTIFLDVTSYLLTPKTSGPFWWILGLKYVLIDMWGSDQNEMIVFYFQPKDLVLYDAISL